MPNSKQIVYLSQAQYQELITNGTITVDGVTVTYNENDIYVTPQAEPITDVRVAGTSVAANGVANIPLATTSTAGAVIIDGQNQTGVQLLNGKLQIRPAADNDIKGSWGTYRVLTPETQDKSTFYGLAKAAGHDEASSTEAFGTYTDAAKGSIQQMLGVSSLIAPSEPTLVASQAYAVGDVFTANGKLYKVTSAIAATETIVVQDEGETVSGHNAEETSLSDGFVKWTDYACNTTPQTQKAGIIGVTPVWSGIHISADGGLYLNVPNADLIKRGTDNSRTSLIHQQHLATFYGLAKAAGDTTQSQSDNAVGTYTDAAKSAIQHMLGTDTNLAPYESDTTSDAAYVIGEMFMLNGKLHQATAAIAIGDTLTVGTNCAVVNASEVFPHDVQVNGTSVVQDGVANVPMAADRGATGVVKINRSFGITETAGILTFQPTTVDDAKGGASALRAVLPSIQHASTFYGLAKASGDTTQSASSNAVGQYTDNAKASIKSMLGIVDGSTGTVDISGTTPTITAVENTRYVCGEVATLSITPPASGICIIRFTSGTTATVLTATGVVWPEWFDATALETERVYEICITDGYGMVVSWAQ